MKKPLHNKEVKQTLEERVDELELLLLEQSFWIDELEEEIDLLKEGPNIIIKEIHHYHPAPVNVWPQVTPVLNYPTFSVPYCSGTGSTNIVLR